MWIAAAAAAWLAALMMISAYNKGMFFDSAFFFWEGLLALTPLASLAAGLVYRWRASKGRKPLLQEGEAPAGETFPHWRQVPVHVYGLFGISLLYAGAMLHHPASMQGSLEQALRYAAYGAFLWSCYYWFAGQSGRRLWQAALQAAGLFLLGGALVGWLGWIVFPDIIMVTDNAELSAVGARLSGFVQYPNTLGALAAAFLLWQWLLMARAGSLLAFAVPAALSGGYGLVLLLTESRGAWLAAAIGWLFAFAVVKGSDLRRWLVFSGWSLVSVSAAYRIAITASVVNGTASVPGGRLVDWQLAGVGLAGFLGLIGLRYAMARIPYLRLSGALGFWLMTAFMAVWIAPSAASGRLEGHFDTAAARTLFYRDSWELIRKAPLLGRGGDTWRTLFRQVQSEPYVGSEVHSGYLELVLDLGLAGLLFFLVILAAWFTRIWRSDRTGLIPIIVLLIHATVDFDMSFGYYWLVLLGWVMLYSSPTVGEWEGHRRLARRKPAALHRMLARDRLLGGLAACLLLAAAAGSWQLNQAQRKYDEAMEVIGDQGTALLQQALAANPNLLPARLALADSVPPEERRTLLLQGLSKEPESPQLWFALGEASAVQGEVRRAADEMAQALRLDRFHAERQTAAVLAMAEMAEESAARGHEEEARFAARQAIEFEAEYARLTGEDFRVNSRDFELREEAVQAAKRSKELLARLDSRPVP